MTDKDGNVVTYDYDALNRLVDAAAEDSAGTTIATTGGALRAAVLVPALGAGALSARVR